MPPGFARVAGRRAVQGALFVLIVSSAALTLTHLAPGDHLSAFDAHPAAAAAERHRLGLDRPFAQQYASWLMKLLRLDFGTSLAYGRPVRALVAERAGNSILLGLPALALATAFGLAAGTLSGADRSGRTATLIRGVSVTVLSIPTLVAAFGLLLLAAKTGWLPVGGFPNPSPTWSGAIAGRVRYLVLPTLALAVPLGASLERLHANAIHEALALPSIQAARARGLGERRVLWKHALRLSLTSLLSIYGIVLAGTLSGSFVVEVVMGWPGLGALMWEALVARDLYLVAGCAAAVSAMLACGVLASDLALALADPRAGRAA